MPAIEGSLRSSEQEASLSHKQLSYTSKNLQVVTDLQTSCNKVVVKLSSRYQDVFALLVPLSCCDKSRTELLSPCYKVDNGNRLATYKLFQQEWNKLFSLGPVYEFVCVLFRTGNLNCFRVKWPWRSTFELVVMDLLTTCCRQYQTCWNNVCDAVSECVHTKQAEKFAWPRWIEPTTFDLLVRCSTNRATRSSRFECVIFSGNQSSSFQWYQYELPRVNIQHQKHIYLHLSA